MSIPEFSAALKNKALASWFKLEAAGGGSASKATREAYSLENVNALVNPVNIYRSGEQTAEKTAFIITKDTVRDLLVSLKGVTDPGQLELMTDEYFNLFRKKGEGVAVKRKKITVGNGIPAVYFPNIAFDSITNLVNRILNISPGELSKYYEKGHVVSLTTELLQETAERIQKVDTTGVSGKAFLLDQLDKVIAYYKRLDLASANLKPASDISIYAQYEKRASRRRGAKYLVELQTKSTNRESAEEVKATLGTIRKLFTPAGLSEAAIEKLLDKLKASVTDPKFQQDLLQMKSSPPLIKMVEKMFVDTLSGKEGPEQVYTGTNLLVGVKKLPKLDTSNIKREINTVLQQAATLKTKIKSTRAKVVKPDPYLNLFSLQSFINSHLQDVISANMGDGRRRDILNYRTGRFAGSVRVEKLSQSREGMITAFYSYMKNPYATFSDGGRQQNPRSRDPKLLITKSIREIAAEKVANRLRAVVV